MSVWLAPSTFNTMCCLYIKLYIRGKFVNRLAPFCTIYLSVYILLREEKNLKKCTTDILRRRDMTPTRAFGTDEMVDCKSHKGIIITKLTLLHSYPHFTIHVYIKCIYLSMYVCMFVYVQACEYCIWRYMKTATICNGADKLHKAICKIYIMMI